MPFATGELRDRRLDRARELRAGLPVAESRALLLRGHAARDRPVLRATTRRRSLLQRHGGERAARRSSMPTAGSRLRGRPAFRPTGSRRTSRRPGSLALERAAAATRPQGSSAVPHHRPRRPDRPRRALRRRDVQAHPSNRADLPGPDYEAPGARATSGSRAGSSRALRRAAVRLAPVPERRELLPCAAPTTSTPICRSGGAWAHQRERREGIYMPCFSRRRRADHVLPAGGGAGSAGAVAARPRSGGDGGTIQTKRSGYEGLEYRPHALRGEGRRAPRRAGAAQRGDAGLSATPDREFGPWGLSFASDRWDLRRALVLEPARQAGHGLRDRGAPGPVRGPPDAPAALSRHLRRQERDDQRGHVRRALERGPRGLSALARRSGARSARDRPGRCVLREPGRERRAGGASRGRTSRRRPTTPT